MSLRIAGRGVELEAVLRAPDGALRAATVLCHPHLVYGGTMDNRVIFRASKAALEAGVAALRFNFRGVGASTGSFDHGEGEKEDVRAAIDFLEETYVGLPLVLIGFSFGAWVGLRLGCQDQRIQAMAALGLPVTSYDFDFLAENRKPTLFLAGASDEHCPRGRMERLARRLPPSSILQWVEEADHFFTGHLEELQTAITDFLRRLEFVAGD